MDRRYYQRTRIDIECVCFLANKETFPREFNASLEDISESGVKVVIGQNTPSEIINSVDLNDSIHFTAYDEYELFGQEKDALLSGKVIVVRKETADGKIILGCRLDPPTADLLNYVLDKKTCSFCEVL